MCIRDRTATVALEKDVADSALLDAVNEAGFQAISVEEKKGLLG